MVLGLTVTRVSPAVYQACWEVLGMSLKRKAEGWADGKLSRLEDECAGHSWGPSTWVLWMGTGAAVTACLLENEGGMWQAAGSLGGLMMEGPGCTELD